MLFLSRKINEAIRVEGPCLIKVIAIRGGRIRLGIEADKDVKIMRTELEETKDGH